MNLEYVVPDNFSFDQFLTTCLIGGVVLQRTDLNPSPNGWAILRGQNLEVCIENAADMQAAQVVVDAAVAVQG